MLHATSLLAPGQSERLSFTAPSKLGEYPYVCTFPGHWQRMYGTLHVVRSLDDVSPDALLAASASTTPAASRPFVQAWTVEDLVSELEALNQGRDRDRGKQLFTTLSCVQCHRMNGEGGQVGPDLAGVREKLDARKMAPADVLVEMIQPSKVIDEKFRNQVLALSSGEVLTGIVEDRGDGTLLVRTNPLALDREQAEPKLVRADDIEERTISQVSLMPEGLLNTLTREEVLDLLSYILSAEK